MKGKTKVADVIKENIINEEPYNRKKLLEIHEELKGKPEEQKKLFNTFAEDYNEIQFKIRFWNDYSPGQNQGFNCDEDEVYDFDKLSYYLGFCYEMGLGIPRNIQSAMWCYCKVKNDQNLMLQAREAMMGLGNFYTSTDEVFERSPENKQISKEQRRSLAFHFFKIVADQNHLPGLYPLGLCYESGFGVTQDQNLADSLFKRASVGGDARASAKLILNQFRFLGASLPKQDEETDDFDVGKLNLQPGFNLVTSVKPE